MKRAKQVLDAAELLGADERELAAKYKERGELNAFSYLKRADLLEHFYKVIVVVLFETIV